MRGMTPGYDRNWPAQLLLPSSRDQAAAAVPIIRNFGPQARSLKAYLIGLIMRLICCEATST